MKFDLVRPVTSTICRFFFLVVFLLMTCHSVHAQQQFTPLTEGDYKIVHEDLSFTPNAQVNGHFFLNGSMYRDGFLMGSPIDRLMVQDFEIEFTSKINSNLSMNIAIGNASPDLADQDTNFVTQHSQEQTTLSSNAGGLDVVFSQAYLEYNHNPNAIFRVGLQPVDIGDSDGMIYRGDAIAATQSCGIGTWCYQIGGARLGDNGGLGLVWAQLDYPVYESGEKIVDHWEPEQTRNDVSFNVKILQALVASSQIPLAEYGGRTGDNSTYHETRDSSTDYVYYYPVENEYLGLFVDVNFHEFDFGFKYVGLGGSRNYYTANEDLGTKSASGYASSLDVGYSFNDSLKGSAKLFVASGNTTTSADPDIWSNSSTAFYEIRKGSYGNALIYFNDEYGIGTGHSISNVTFANLNIFYRFSKEISMEGRFYAFNRTQPVVVQFTGESAKSVSEIGTELDYTVNWQLEKNLLFSAQIAYFRTGEAYTVNDNVSPTTRTDDFSLISLSCRYSF